MVERWNGGIVEWWKDGMVESGMVERWKGGMVEWWNELIWGFVDEVQGAGCRMPDAGCKGKGESGMVDGGIGGVIWGIF